jgi:hypothetical protein
MSFSLLRVDPYSHRIVLQLATQHALRFSLLFGSFPLLQVLYTCLCVLWISKSTSYTRHSRKATRAQLCKHRSSCTDLAYRTFIYMFVLYLCMFFMYVDPPSGRRCILTVSYTSPSNTRRRQTANCVPFGVKHWARQCDKALTLISSIYGKHQASTNNSSMLACWLWSSVYSNIDPLPYTSICIPSAEAFACTFLAMYFLLPIVLSSNLPFFHDTNLSACMSCASSTLALYSATPARYNKQTQVDNLSSSHRLHLMLPPLANMGHLNSDNTL